MKKSLIVLSALAFTSLTAVAGAPEMVAPPPPPPCFDGLYIGAGVGAIAGQFETTHTTNFVDLFASNPGAFGLTPVASPFGGLGSSGAFQTIGLNQRFRGGDANVTGTVFIGYGKVFNSLYAGLELFGATNGTRNRPNVNSFTSSPFTSPFGATTLSPAFGTGFAQGGNLTSFISHNTRVNTNTLEGGVDARLGWLITPMTMIYGRVGVVFNQLKLQTDSTIRQNVPVGLTAAGTPISPIAATSFGFVNQYFTWNTNRTRSTAGFRVGGGIEQCLNSDWSLRADYIYTNYGRVTYDVTTPVVGSVTSNLAAPSLGTGIGSRYIVQNVSSRVSSNQVLLSVVYHLNCLL